MKRHQILSTLIFCLILFSSSSLLAAPSLGVGDCIKCHELQPTEIESAGAAHKDQINCLDCHAAHKPVSPSNIPLALSVMKELNTTPLMIAWAVTTHTNLLQLCLKVNWKQNVSPVTPIKMPSWLPIQACTQKFHVTSATLPLTVIFQIAHPVMSPFSRHDPKWLCCLSRSPSADGSPVRWHNSKLALCRMSRHCLLWAAGDKNQTSQRWLCWVPRR